MRATREQQIEDLCIASMLSAVITLAILAIGHDDIPVWKCIIGGCLMYFAMMQVIFNLTEIFIRTKGEPRP
jgi:uncharacterized membrane protein